MEKYITPNKSDGYIDNSIDFFFNKQYNYTVSSHESKIVSFLAIGLG